jgi:hypothetical protein
MLKIILVALIVLIGLFLICFPFWHVGGTYYRGLLLIYDIRQKASSGGFLPPLPFEKEITLLKWADPTSFEYIGDSYAKDRFSVYSQYKLDGFDPKTFRQIQAPLTGEYFYIDKDNLRSYSILILKQISDNGGEDRAEKFDMESFQLLGANLVKDKNGVYSFSKTSWSLYENMYQPDGFNDRVTNLFKNHEELDAQTFKIDFCDEKVCQASDKNNVYIFNHYKKYDSGVIVMKKL